MREKAPKKILVVDDHERVRTVISRLLAAQNYLMVQASNGEEAYTKAVAEQPDLILLDIMMPVMDGYEALLKIKEHPVTQATPVLMLSGLDQHFKQRFVLEMGALGYLVKPVRVMICMRVSNLPWTRGEGLVFVSCQALLQLTIRRISPHVLYSENWPHFRLLLTDC
jgi:PleD family two-component response regulator